MSWQDRWMKPQAAVPDRQFAVFVLGELEYAVDIMRIHQIIQPQPVRPVPRAPRFVAGVIERRGVVIPIMNLRGRFGLPTTSLSRAAKFIIVRLDRRLVGIAVDQVVGVHRVERRAIRPTPDWITGPEAAVFSGVCRREDRLVLIVDLAELIASDVQIDLAGLQADDLQVDPEVDWSASEPVEEVEADGVGDDLDDWWEGE